jgi:hypothetical protein
MHLLLKLLQTDLKKKKKNHASMHAYLDNYLLKCLMIWYFYSLYIVNKMRTVETDTSQLYLDLFQESHDTWYLRYDIYLMLFDLDP